MTLELNAHHLEVLAGIDECPEGRLTDRHRQIVLPTAEHGHALSELLTHGYVFRRHVGTMWHPATVYRLTKRGRAAIAPTVPERPATGILLG